MNTTNSVIRDLIIPLDRYPHLNENQTLQAGIETFMSFCAGPEERLLYSMLLVVNDQNQLVGKLSLLDIIHGLVPRLREAAKVDKFEGKGVTSPDLTFLYEEAIFAKCGKNQHKPIKPLLQAIDFSLAADTHVLKALVMMSLRNDFNVPVTDNGAIIGVLRLAEVFKAMCMTYCPIQ